jgi:hypothetical protein
MSLSFLGHYGNTMRATLGWISQIGRMELKRATNCHDTAKPRGANTNLKTPSLLRVSPWPCRALLSSATSLCPEYEVQYSSPSYFHSSFPPLPEASTVLYLVMTLSPSRTRVPPLLFTHHRSPTPVFNRLVASSLTGQEPCHTFTLYATS